MKLFFLLFLVSCSSFHSETPVEQNDQATEANQPSDRVR